MDFSTTINSFNTEFSLNAVSDYNKYLQSQGTFEFDPETTAFSQALESAAKSIPLKDKQDPMGLGSFANTVGQSIGGGLDSVNKLRIEADRMQEDLAKGGPTSIHEAMIAAEKAELSLQMAVQVRNRILSAYNEITNMAL